MTHDHDQVPRPTAAQTAAALHPPAGRTGGDLVIETLSGLGATTVFGLPGQHVPGLSDALRRSSLRHVGLRTETGAGYAADAYGRITGEAAPLFLPAGPGALLALAALQEAAAASAPVLAVGPGGHLHGPRDRQAGFRDVVKSVHTARTHSQIPSALAAAWKSALTVPHGPVRVEIPQDVLLAETVLPVVTAMDATPEDVVPRPELTAVAAHLLTTAERPAIIAGGGVVRSDAAGKLRALAEKLDAPVVTTFGGKGAFPWKHPLSLRSWPEDRHTTDLLEDADVLLVVGSGLGALPPDHRAFAPRGRIVQIEADAGKLEAHHPALGIHADARIALQALLETVGERTDPTAPDRVRAVLDRIRARRDAQGPDPERRLVEAIRAALPSRSPGFWDMTALTRRAWSAFDARHPNTTHSAQGAGGPGYALPAALGAAVADPTVPVLAVSGEGGALYAVAELATAREHGLDVTWLIVDDDAHGGTAPARPDLVALADSFGVPAVRTTPDTLTAALSEALAAPGPSVVVLPALPRTAEPTRP
ncbi:thiamine pyrophosphate-binding protein [Streptomyces termitum]